jgi:hypothetical protein
MALTPISTRISSQTRASDNTSNKYNNNQQQFAKLSNKIQSESKAPNNSRFPNANGHYTDRNSAYSNFTQETSFKIETPSMILDSSYMGLIPESFSPTNQRKQFSDFSSFKHEVNNRLLETPAESINNLSTVLFKKTLNILPTNTYSIDDENGELSVKIGRKNLFLPGTSRPRAMSKIFENESHIKSHGGTWKKSKAIKKNYKLSNHIIEQYGRFTEADSISKLDVNQLEFFKNTNYISYLRLIYPKLSINLNENLKNLYFFGARDQVNDAKLKIVTDLNAFKTIDFTLNQKELIDFLQKPDVKIKINDFINHYIIDCDKEKRKDETSEKEFGKSDVFKVFFCNYQVRHTIMKKENIDPTASGKYFLRVFTNIINFEKVLLRHINESIIVNYKIEIPNHNTILESISKQERNWTDIYLKYSKYLDLSIESYMETNVLGERKPNWGFKQKKWFIKLTGFRNELEKFKKEFKMKFFV